MKLSQLQRVAELCNFLHVQLRLVCDSEMKDGNGSNCMSPLFKKLRQPPHIFHTNIEPKLFQELEVFELLG